MAIRARAYPGEIEDFCDQDLLQHIELARLRFGKTHPACREAHQDLTNSQNLAAISLGLLIFLRFVGLNGMSVELGALALSRSGFLSLLRQSFSAHGIFLFPVSLYCLAYELLQHARPDLAMESLFPSLLIVFVTMCIFFTIGLTMMRFYHIARYVKPESPARELASDLKRFLSDRRRLANGLPIMIVMSVMGFIFSEIQGSTLFLNPNGWDAYFAGLDKWLHFGKQPWEWLHPFLGYGPITFLINVNYNLWFFTMIMLLIYFGFASISVVARTRFILSYIALWVIGGNVLAVILSSAGPCYYGRLGLSPDPYHDLMAYLRHVNESIPVWAVGLQDLLWEGHMQKAGMREVSAMPSLHNASALLFAFMGYQISRFWGRVLTFHAFLIYIGSIHLGWHYAVDSYLSWALTIVVWYATAPVARWWHNTNAQKDFEASLALTT
jgi:PAP2 superfamily